MLIISLNNWELGEFVIDRKTLRRIFSNRPRSFWFNAFGLTSISITSNMLLQFLLPLYSVSVLELSFEATGTLVAVFSLLSGIIMMGLLWKKVSAKPLIALAALMIPALLLVPFSGDLIFLLVLFLAIGNGASMIVAEYILADSVKESGEISTDIGLIYMPLRLSEFIFLFCAGFIIAGFGYAPLFIVCAACVAFFVLFARKYFR
jgi:MFS family permease